MIKSLFWFIWLSLVFSFDFLHASDLDERKEEDVLESEDQKYLAALQVLKNIDDDAAIWPGAFEQVDSSSLGLVCSCLDKNDLIHIRSISKCFYRFNDAINWFATRFTDRHRCLNSDRTCNKLSVSALQMRAILCMHRRLLQPVMKPTLAELAFIEANLMPHEKFKFALFYLAALRGDSQKTLDALAALAVFDDHARALWTEANVVGKLGKTCSQGVKWQNFDFKDLLPLIQESGFVHIARVVYEETQNQKEWKSDPEELAQLLAPDSGASPSIQKFILKAIQKQTLGFRAWPRDKRLAEIKSCALHGDGDVNRYARDLFAKALSEVPLDAKDKFERLEDLALQCDLYAGCPYAQMVYISSLTEGYNSNPFKPAAEKFAQLKKLAEVGSLEALGQLFEALYTGKLGQKLRPEEEWLKELEKVSNEIEIQAQKGCPIAQRCLSEAAWHTQYGPKTKAGGIFQAQDDVKALAEAGNPYAQKKFAANLNSELAYQGIHGSIIIRRLNEYCDNPFVVRLLIEALDRGLLNQYERSERERIKELRKIVEVGHVAMRAYAQDLIEVAEFCKKLGESSHDLSRQFAKLKKLDAQARSKADLDMQAHLVDNLKHNISAATWPHRFAKLQKMAANGNFPIRSLIIKIASKNTLALEENCSYHVELCYDFFDLLLESLLNSPANKQQKKL